MAASIEKEKKKIGKEKELLTQTNVIFPYILHLTSMFQE